MKVTQYLNTLVFQDFLTDFKNFVKLLFQALNCKVFSFEKALMGRINRHSLKQIKL